MMRVLLIVLGLFLVGLAAYLAEEAPLRADAIIERILSRVDALETLPGRGRTIPELRGVADENWRELQERPWRIIYQVVPSGVRIHGVARVECLGESRQYRPHDCRRQRRNSVTAIGQ